VNAELEETVFILYGATGDLAKRMVLPAFYQLHVRGLLPQRWKLVGNGRGDVAHEDFRAHVHDSLTEFAEPPEADQWEAFAGHLLFAGGGFRSHDPGSLLAVIDEAKDDLGPEPKIIHYLAIPPSAFAPTTEAIKTHELTDHATAVYEKPYGTSPDSLAELDALVRDTFAEEQIYRIDHFLGKEATQNLHVLRFANRLFGGAWNSDFVSEVQIDVPETLDIADRAEFYDETGAALDMLVTHLFQMAAEVAMEPPLSLRSEDLQAARESVISAFRPLDPDEVVLGQYASYRQTEGIADDSDTDTFVAARLWVDTDRWRGVPFLLRTGKMLAASAQRVSLVFKPAEGPLHSAGRHPGVLTFDLKSKGAIELTMTVKRPGPELVPDTVDQSLPLGELNDQAMEPYTALLYDVFRGDRSLFTTGTGLAHAFAAFAPLLGNQRPEVISYPDGSWGPPEADRLAGERGWLLGPPDDERSATLDGGA
jgi:glucose-6-phosphate 1-dehydrogenase